MARSRLDHRTRPLFRSISGQEELFEKSYEEELEARRSQTVECLGMTFESDEARREYFLERLKLQLPELRRRPDFPIGEDEDILRLSDPPYYTACPNPFLAEFVKCHGQPYNAKEPYHREPLAVDVSEGKTDPLLQGSRLPHQGPASGNCPVHFALHEARRHRPGRFLRLWHDRGGRTVVRHGATGVPERTRTAMAQRGARSSEMGCAPCDSRGSVASSHLHRREFQHPIRPHDVQPCCRATSEGSRVGDRLDVRDTPHRRQYQGTNQLHRME